MPAKTVLLAFISQLLLSSSSNRTCVPYSQYLENGKLCVCDNNGQLNETNCHVIGRRRHMCPSGQIIWQGCNQCICQESGQLACSMRVCPDETNKRAPSPVKQTITPAVPNTSWCVPYRSYYVNCSVCVCPPSAQISEAKCVRDKFCTIEESASLKKLVSGNNVCIPNVMYLFPCLQCLCSDGGIFSLDKCVATCHSNQKSKQKCTPRIFFKKDCNVCWCPDEGFLDEKFCTNAVCNNTSKLKMLRVERRNTNKCVPNSFTKPKCFYCICTSDGKINEKACLQLDCLKKFEELKDECTPGEMVSVCIQCLCLRNGQTYSEYCSKSCTSQSRLEIFIRVLNESITNDQLLDRNIIRSNIVNNFCQPYSVYKKDNKYCICPENGYIDMKACAIAVEYPFDNINSTHKLVTTEKSKEHASDLKKCDPHTFVQIDCNTCYCSKNGTIDPQWCTYDDCESKRIIAKGRKSVIAMSNSELSNTCTPGSVLKEGCNFCICPNNGSYFGRTCTKNTCDATGGVNEVKDEIITCDPLTYFVVDCNTCLCPEDGIKNVGRCSKNICEKSFLRSSACEPGHLFSEDCNVCVCPPNGDRNDRVCTNHTCSEADAPWKRIFKISQNLLSNQPSDGIRQLDVCFPGEEFTIGCKLCICPDIGLKAYATCTHMQCEEEHSPNLTSSQTQQNLRRAKEEHCVEQTVNGPGEMYWKCTAGSMYIMRCKECICPMSGDLMAFCRPMRGYCEQKFPNVNYPALLGRRNDGGKVVDVTGSDIPDLATPLDHNHTAHKCYKPGKIMDECFICECDDGEMVVIEEHCYKSAADKCRDAQPDFLKDIDWNNHN
ncbi:uncharacterized protein LOC128679759 isoform X2 [Plodia interpunctella]|uniref:uncharacterized protein LOC128679759 isoform X2 n=1 Tax=Plodia interpunctella TaxID=58824 RepID=UPI002368C213|nr:uncharacterized protein LOC128679759 isoform X2 [Plodia interpunctella]